MPAPDLVIFDCDGVLVDSEVLACRTDAAVFTEIGFPETADSIMARYVGISAKAMFADVAARHGRALPDDISERLHARLATVFAAELSAIPGIADAVRALTAPVCVASSSRPERIRHSLTLTGLVDLFAPHLFSATMVANGKPAPDLFLHAASRMGADPARCLVIEDSLAGVTAGVAAGMRVLGFTGGGHCGPGHAERLIAAGAATTFSRMADLPRLAA
jgi:HAD superfamily hydrolase (TIGR01509 family)